MKKWIGNQAEQLEVAGNTNAQRSVEELVAYVLGCKPLEIYFKSPSEKQISEMDALVERALKGEPIQYIIGSVDFRGLKIACDSRALIPRSETELLVEEVLKFISGFKFPVSRFIQIVDVCTGTGCVGLALAAEIPQADVTAIDLSGEALSLARENAEMLGLSERFTCLKNNLLEGVESKSLDVVVSNPPYILTDVWNKLEPCVRDHEPKLALDGGADGLDLVRPLVQQASIVLKPSGGLFLEIGFDQGEAVSQCLTDAGFRDVRIVQDHAGLDRFVVGSLPG